jgi:hypothetical protein
MPTPRKQALRPDTFYAAGHLGLNQTEVGQLHGVSERRVRQLLEIEANRVAYERGKAEIKTKLVKKVIELAEAGNITACIWAMKNMAGWTDKSETRTEKTENINVRWIAAWDVPAALPSDDEEIVLTQGEWDEE